MLTVTKTTENRLDLTLEGQLDSAMMRFGLEDMLEKSEAIENGRMLYRIKDFMMPTGWAVAVEFEMMPRLLRVIGRFEKCAVLADQTWLKFLAELEGRLIPGLEIKAFDPSDEAAAEAWLAE